MGPGTRTAWQHDPRELANGTISLFDNGASPTVHGQSRGIVLSLDPQHKTATLLSQIIHPPPLLAASQGNMQALANGDWFVGWGQVPDFSEFSAAGAAAVRRALPRARAVLPELPLRVDGHAGASARVRLPGRRVGRGNRLRELERRHAGGRLESAGGIGAGRMGPVAQVPRTGFETSIALPAGTKGPVVEVEALDASGQLIGSSEPASEASLG